MPPPVPRRAEQQKTATAKKDFLPAASAAVPKEFEFQTKQKTMDRARKEREAKEKLEAEQAAKNKPTSGPGASQT